MKKLLLMLTLMLSPAVYADANDIVEISVSGLKCAFCVDKLDRSLEELSGIDNAEVDLDAKKARIVMKSGSKADLAAIRSAIVDAGFTPGDVIGK